MFGDANHVNLLQINGLVQHYRYHKKLDKSLGIIAFLKMHYQGKHGNDTRCAAHKKLPFKTTNSGRTATLLSYEVPVFFAGITQKKYNMPVPEGEKINAIPQNGYPSLLLRPPSLH